jgi:threonine/homoserine/homoserine lactone efflux protein
VIGFVNGIIDLADILIALGVAVLIWLAIKLLRKGGS